MKHIATLLTMAITFTGLAQQMPYNPDANGDDFVGVDDVLGVLGVYDTALMQPDLTCDYEGTDLESWFGDLFSGNITLDSIYVEYQIVDTMTTFLPGCPDPVDIETVLQRSYVINNVSYVHFNSPTPWIFAYSTYLGFERKIHFHFYPDFGEYTLRLEEEEVGVLTSFSQDSYALGTHEEYCCNNVTGDDWCCSAALTMPFDADWGLDEDGFNVEWRPVDWAANCQNFRLIPFWHEAE